MKRTHNWGKRKRARVKAAIARQALEPEPVPSGNVLAIQAREIADLSERVSILENLILETASRGIITLMPNEPERK